MYSPGFPSMAPALLPGVLVVCGLLGFLARTAWKPKDAREVKLITVSYLVLACLVYAILLRWLSGESQLLELALHAAPWACAWLLHRWHRLLLVPAGHLVIMEDTSGRSPVPWYALGPRLLLVPPFLRRTVPLDMRETEDSPPQPLYVVPLGKEYVHTQRLTAYAANGDPVEITLEVRFSERLLHSFAGVWSLPSDEVRHSLYANSVPVVQAKWFAAHEAREELRRSCKDAEALLSRAGQELPSLGSAESRREALGKEILLGRVTLLEAHLALGAEQLLALRRLRELEDPQRRRDSLKQYLLEHARTMWEVRQQMAKEGMSEPFCTQFCLDLGLRACQQTLLPQAPL